MKFATNIAYRSVAFSVLTLLIGLGVGSVSVYQHARHSVTLTCGHDSFVVSRLNMTDEIRNSCQRVTELDADSRMKTDAAPLMICGTGITMIGAVKIDPARASEFNVLCDKYKAQFARIPEIALNGNTQDLQKFTQQIREKQRLSEEFRAEARTLSPDDSKHQAALKDFQQARKDLRSQIMDAGGGYEIKPDQPDMQTTIMTSPH